jgi:hypothetical protein
MRSARDSHISVLSFPSPCHATFHTLADYSYGLLDKIRVSLIDIWHYGLDGGDMTDSEDYTTLHSQRWQLDPPSTLLSNQSQIV